jgi:hypothetical protein
VRASSPKSLPRGRRITYAVRCPVTVRVSPKRERDRYRIELDPTPPCRLITVPVKLAMMEPANRNRELIADLAAQRPRKAFSAARL